MLAVLDVAKHVFWNDTAFNRKLLPSEAALEKCSYTIADLTTMTGKERISVFQQCGIDPSLFPLFLRSLQHITALHGAGKIDGNYMIHRHLSARQWSPFYANTPLLGYASVNSLSYREQCSSAAKETKSEDVADLERGRTCHSHYNGLLNQGATCYLNSLLQALFHITAFRAIIYQMPTKDEAEQHADLESTVPRSIPYALQRLFCHLQMSTRAVGTCELTESFGWGASDSFIQHDVHELTRVLLDNLEEKLNAQQAETGNPKPKENAIHRLFTGSLESYVKVEEANYYGSREEPFYDLQLVVKNKKNIYSSFDAFFQVEVLDGKNKYCLECNGKKSYHRAEKGVRFKTIPPILLLHLARFDYDIQQGETKVLTRWDYYNTLDLSRYMPESPSTDTHYTLCSVLVHSGSNTGFGHYFCFLLCSGAWYKFNDEAVTPAKLKEVFGDNFGGFKLNYWGSEIPNTANAYMLVYIRTSQLSSILCPIGSDDVPQHVVQQLERERVEHERRVKEQAEDYLYGRVHFILPNEITDQEEYLTSRRPAAQKFSSHKTLRIPLDDEALPAFEEFVKRQLGVDAEQQLLWFASSRTGGSEIRLSQQVRANMKVRQLLQNAKECCVLVTTPATATVIELDQGCVSREYQVFHHKLYDPLQLKVLFLGCTVLHRDPNGDAKQALESMELHVRSLIADLPDLTKQLHGHHLKKPPKAKQALPSKPRSATSLETYRSNQDLSSRDEAEMTEVRRGMPQEALGVVRETEAREFLPCSELYSGDILIWKLDTPNEDPANIFYPDIQSYQHFLLHRIPVELKLNRYPDYPLLIATELAEDMTYEQLQRYVARLIGDMENYDRVRFTRHNPETELPYFMKGKKHDRATLARLLMPASSRVPALSKYLYYEYCKYTVTEIENAHSLQFKLYGDNVKVVSTHWILLPHDLPITADLLFPACVREIQKDYAAGACPAVAALLKEDPENTSNNSTITFVKRLMQMDCKSAHEWLRLVDVWRGRVYNILDKNHTLVFEHNTFEESAEYRIEHIPAPIPGVPSSDQAVFQVHHFTMVRQRRDAIETHSEPFSMYVNFYETSNQLLRRIAAKLEMIYAAVQDWKVCLVKESRVEVIAPDALMGSHITNFCLPECYQPNQIEPSKAAFIGLEHAPLSKRTGKREDKVLILN
ncbi:putative cysteine peptidase, Clan CA, family C19 [Leishmania infantum JPCM5]|uniref:ubiquitinyl hydrolase 1 n=2 Tax=Leishmania infantum TaxID=5671 RepID=A0A6L0Y096_LEIIN|nr:putative cysteine peptidase, Clan CA, family C19 [Leishmania infantum JPCM5]CAC9544188.1 ubiquitin_hydrolase_-_putative [Leishmania infantum]CAM72088.1 putative cysteine peptidase, Clan CA, family C19 [Leishmania infantum JPCM5]SUZ46003.1 ubiquitin_hydrolase_-_putative [Leishmania infantum]|eukprot:XP_001468993.1 putative cysteine peptidase, Clan CA, family C19 [Leishmania infantum JPCM5]